MTMFDTAPYVEEVKTNPILDALRLPFNASVAAKVKRFGFEYEMFPSHFRPDEIEVDTDDVWSDDHDPCNCESCLRQRIEDRIEELRDGSGEIQHLINRAHANGLISDPDRHDYHCDCDECDYRRSSPLMTCQSDCSCGVEFVSRILNLDNFEGARMGINQWVGMMQQWKDDGFWMPDGYVSNGNHVHVSHKNFESRSMNRAALHINAIYAAFDWIDVADGGCGQIRGYNSKPGQHDAYASWLSTRDETFEHRLWNTPCNPERLWAHLGLSIAITRWAFAISERYPEFSFWSSRTDPYGARMDDYTFETLHLNLGDVIQGIRQYIPDNACFDIARDLILSLS